MLQFNFELREYLTFELVSGLTLHVYCLCLGLVDPRSGGGVTKITLTQTHDHTTVLQ